MAHRLLFSCLIVLCALALRPFEIRAEETAPAPVVTAPATKALPKYAKAQLGDNQFSTFQVEWALGPADRFLAGSFNGFVRLWDMTSQKVLWEIQTEKQATPAALAFSGKDEAVVVLESGLVLVLNLKDGTEARRFQIDLTGKPSATEDFWAYMEVRVANGILLTASPIADETDEMALRAWSLKDGAPLQAVQVQGLGELALSEDGTQAAWVTTKILNTEEGDNSNSYTPVRVNVWIAPTADLSRATKILDEKRQNDIDERSDRQAFNRHPDLLLFSPDGATLVYGALSGIRLWSASGGVAKDLRAGLKPEPTAAQIEEDEHIVDTLPLVGGIVFSVDGKYLLANIEFSKIMRDLDVFGSVTQVYDTTTGAFVIPPADVVWAANPTALPMTQEGVIRPEHPSNSYFDSSSNQLTFAGKYYPPDGWVGHITDISSLAVSTSGVRASNGSYPMYGEADNGKKTLIVWAQNGDAKAYDNGVERQFWLSDTKIVAVDLASYGAGTKDVRVWDVTKKSKPKVFSIPEDAILVDPLPDGQWIACVEGDLQRLKADFTVNDSFKDALAINSCDIDAANIASGRAIIRENRIVDLASGDSLMALPSGGVLSPDGKYVVVFSEGEEFKILDVDSKEVRLTISPSEVQLLSFSADSSAIVYTIDRVLYVHARTKEGTWPAKGFAIEGHPLPIMDYEFSGDTKTLVTLQKDGLMYAWDWPAIQAAALGLGQ